MRQLGTAATEPEEEIRETVTIREPVSLDETRLIRRVREGDVQAFEKLYRTHVGRVHAICLRISGNPSRAEELTQDVFVRVWERIRSYEGRSAFSSWLYRMATNCAIDAYRSEVRRSSRETTTDDPAAWEPPRSRPGPDTAMDLESAIRTLPAGARAAFVLHDIEGYRHGEISAMTGMAEGTSKAQLHRARRLLRERVG